MNAVGRERPITIAILAIGGQGGGVITDWLIALAERLVVALEAGRSLGGSLRFNGLPGVCAQAEATSKVVARAVRCRLRFMLDSGV